MAIFSDLSGLGFNYRREQALITSEQQQAAQKQAAAQQQARVQAVFGNGAAPADMNTAINAQLTSLSERINRINQEFGVG